LTTSGNHDSTRSDRIYMPHFPSPLLTIEGSLLNQAGYKGAFFTYFLKSVIRVPTRIAIYGSVHWDTLSYFPGSKKVGFCPLVSANLPEVHSSLGRSFGPRVSLCLPPFQDPVYLCLILCGLLSPWRFRRPLAAADKTVTDRARWLSDFFDPSR
jgi:hypothetical protein